MKKQKKCKWCGKPFTPTHNRQEYGVNGEHSFTITHNGHTILTNCQKEAEKEHNRKRSIRYYNKNRTLNNNYLKTTSTILGNSNLTGNSTDNFEVEKQLIQKELRRLRLRNTT